jgi:hypothetical protein
VSNFVLVIGDRQALGWILTARRMAFPNAHRQEVQSLRPGDELLLYTTRGAFKNPTRDRGRVIGSARATSGVAVLDDPVYFGGRQYPAGCDLELETLVPFGVGINLADCASALDAFKGAGAGWPIRLRRPLLQITEGDASALRGGLTHLGAGRPTDEVLAQYSRWYRSMNIHPPSSKKS